MSVVDTSTWKPFQLIGANGLFDTYSSGQISVARNLVDGDVPYVGAVFSDKDNGVVRYVTPSDVGQITEGNCIACVCDGAAIGTNMYQPNDFVGTTNLKMLHGSFLNPYTGLFLVTALNAACKQRGYSYFDKRNSDAFCREVVLLPATPDGEPDWAYMETYMQQVLDREELFAEHLASLTAEAVADGHVIDTSTWKAFRVGDLFDIHPTRAYKMTNNVLMDGGCTPVVVNSAMNNGIGGFTTQAATESGHIITFSDTTTGDAIFYQSEPFVGYSHVQGMYPRGDYANCWSDFALMFFTVAFRAVAMACAFDYSNKFRRDVAVDMNVKLPATPDGEPDWVYMETYMQQITQRVTPIAEHITELAV